MHRRTLLASSGTIAAIAALTLATGTAALAQAR